MYRKEIKVLDCTVRDGGLMNKWQFSKAFVKSVYDSCVEAGVDYMEIGYISSEDQFSRKPLHMVILDGTILILPGKKPTKLMKFAEHWGYNYWRISKTGLLEETRFFYTTTITYSTEIPPGRCSCLVG